jgi:hypothetical protein
MDNDSATGAGGTPVGENISPDWPYMSDDPKVPAEDAAEPEWTEYESRLRKYSEERLESLQREDSLQGEELWMDFTTTFSEVAFPHLPSPSCQDWRKLFSSRGVYVKKWRGLQISTALLACAKQAHFYHAEATPPPGKSDQALRMKAKHLQLEVVVGSHPSQTQIAVPDKRSPARCVLRYRTAMQITADRQAATTRHLVSQDFRRFVKGGRSIPEDWMMILKELFKFTKLLLKYAS